MNYEREIRHKYGANARIEFMQFHRKKPSIINDKHVETSLSIGYVKVAEERAREIFPDVLDNTISNKDKLDIYDSIMKKAHIQAEKMVEDVVDLEHIKGELVHDMLLKNNLIKSNGNMDKELETDINSRDQLKRNLFIEVPRTTDHGSIKCYLTTSYDRKIMFRPNSQISAQVWTLVK